MSTCAVASSVTRLEEQPSNSPRREEGVPQHLFGNVCDWPSINDRLEALSQHLFATHGILAWQGMGGQVGSDGRLTFGVFSTPALQAIDRVLLESPGIRWDDNTGSWALRLIDDKEDPTQRLAHAICFDGSAQLLDSVARARLASRLHAHIDPLILPGRAWDQNDRDRYVQLHRCDQQIQRATDAERFLLYLHRSGCCVDGDVLLIPAEELAVAIWPQETDRPDDWATDLADRLRGVLGYQLAVLGLSRFGWDPQVLAQASAVSSITFHRRDTFRVCVPPLLGDVLNTFERRNQYPETQLI
jgi:hypothetical protein